MNGNMRSLLTIMLSLAAFQGLAQNQSEERNVVPANVQRNSIEKMESGPQTKAKKEAAAEESAPPVEADAVKDTQASQLMQMNASFQANQYSSTHQTARRSATPQEQAAMDKSVAFFRAADPQSFEANYYFWLAGHYDTAREKALRNAVSMKPADTEVLKQVAMLGIAKNDKVTKDIAMQRLDSVGYFSPGQLAYASDLLTSCTPNSTLILHGFDDFLAVNSVPNPNNISLVSLDLLQSEAYRDQVARHLAVPERKQVDVAFFSELCAANSDRQLQLSMTIPAGYFGEMRDKIYVRGLTFVYSASPVETYDANLRLWREGMNKDLLDKFGDDRFRTWLSNYRAFLTVLEEQAAQSGTGNDAQLVEKDLRNLDAVILADRKRRSR
jgi:hypothetical protein